jgi:hypothetical protein
MTLDTFGHDKLDDNATVLSGDGTVTVFVGGEHKCTVGIQRTASLYFVLTGFKLNRSDSNWAPALELHFSVDRIRFVSIRASSQEA